MSGKPLIFLLNLDKNLYDIKKDNIFAMEKSTAPKGEKIIKKIQQMSGIICLETEWTITKSNNKRWLCSEPLLRFLSESYHIPYIYRIVATYDELRYYLKQFNKKEYAKYNILYFNCHGERHGIQLEGHKELLTLQDLQEIGGTAFQDRFVHFSSCKTMLGSQTLIDEFKEATGAKVVSGYTKTVDTVLSAIHDIALFREYQESIQIPPIFNRLYSLYGGLEDKLGFRTNSFE